MDPFSINLSVAESVVAVISAVLILYTAKLFTGEIRRIVLRVAAVVLLMAVASMVGAAELIYAMQGLATVELSYMRWVLTAITMVAFVFVGYETYKYAKTFGFVKSAFLKKLE